MSPPATGRTDRLAIVLLFLSPALFTINILLARFAAGVVAPATLAFWRFAAAALIVALALAPLVWRHRRAIRREWRDFFLAGACGMSTAGACAYLAGESTTALNIGLVYTVSPVLVIVIGAALLGDRMGPGQGAGVALAIAGVLIIVAQGRPAALAELRFVPGDLWALCGAVGWALYSILLKFRPSTLPALVRFGGMAAGGAALLVPFMILEHLGGRAMPFTAQAWLLVFMAAVPAGAIAYGVYAVVVGRLGPGPSSLTLYLNPLYAGLFGWLLLGEALRWYHLAGAALLLPGVYIATRPGRP